MDLKSDVSASESRFVAFVERLAVSLGHADRVAPMTAYCMGLILPGDRKSVEPMAARLEPGRVRAAHQSLHHFVAKADWSDVAVLDVVRNVVLPVITQSEPIRAWIIDDTGFPKKGTHSVGVARQYCGQLGKQDNCQVAVSLSVANEKASLPVAYRLYLPEVWATDPLRRAKAGIPDDVIFKTKPQIAIEQIQTAKDAGIPPGIVLADAGYGVDTGFRLDLRKLDLDYVVGVQSSTSLWPEGQGPLPPKLWSGKGRPPSLHRRDAEHKPVSAKTLAHALPEDAWQSVTWREGTNTTLESRFAAIRVRPAHRDYWLSAPHAEEWFMVEWPDGEQEPTKYWMSSLSATASIHDLVTTAKLRWRIERDYQDLKQEFGLGHYEGRGWRGVHHHATLCIAAYAFLVSERSLIPPSGPRTSPPSPSKSAIPENYRPRGSPSEDRTSRR